MDMMTALQQEGGVDAVANQLGVDPATAQSGMGALLPSILEGLRGKTDSHPGGLGGLGSILAGLGGGGLLSNVLGSEPTNVNQGNDVLGSKDGSRAVAADAAQKSGVSPDLLKKMLPLVAMLATGYLAKHIGANAGAQTVPAGDAEPHSDSGGILGSLLGGGSGGGILGSILGGLSR